MIYLDYVATNPIEKRALDAIMPKTRLINACITMFPPFMQTFLEIIVPEDISAGTNKYAQVPSSAPLPCTGQFF